jgi:hypothetical protein
MIAFLHLIFARTYFDIHDKTPSKELIRDKGMLIIFKKDIIRSGDFCNDFHRGSHEGPCEDPGEDSRSS